MKNERPERCGTTRGALHRPRSNARVAALVLACAAGVACAGGPSGIQPRGLPGEALPIDLSRFMGDWFVIAHIPLDIEAEAHEAIESYSLRDDGTIDVRFRFCEGSLDGERRELGMDAWVYDPATNAEWRVRPFWPLRLVYQISELDPDYRTTVIVNPSGYAWLMARTPSLPESEVEAVTRRLAEAGYDTAKLRRVPHDDGACRGEV